MPLLTVLHVNTERGWRGGERQLLWLAEGMRDRGHDSIIAARANDELERRARAKDIGLISLRPRGEIDPVSALALRRAIQRYDVHIVHAHTAHAAALAALARLGTRARTIISRRVIVPLRRNPGTWLKYRSARGIIAVSQAVADVAAAGGVSRARLHVVPDGVDLSATPAPASADTLLSLGVSPAASLVVQVAALGRDKDPLTFVRAIGMARARLPSIEGVLVGEGPLRAEIEAEVRRLGLSSAVRLTGFRHDASELLAAAHVASSSSVEEGLGSALLDAMAFGIPVAATRVGGVPEFVVHEHTGLLSPPHDAEALANNIVRLVTDRGLAARLVSQARERVKDYSVDHMVEGTLRVYERVLADED